MNATANRKIVRVTIEHDGDVENPLDYDGWKLHTFDNHKFITCCDATKYVKSYDGTTPVPATIALRRKLEVGTAFWVSCFQHGDQQWGLMGEVHECPWDTARLAGILVWEDAVKDLGPKTYEARQQDARATLATYTDWGNGNCYWFNVEELTPPEDEDFDPDMDDLDDCEVAKEEACGGFIGEDHIVEEIRRVIKSMGLADAHLVLEGDAGWIAEHRDLQKPE